MRQVRARALPPHEGDRARPRIGAVAPQGRESESKRRRCQVFRTRCQVFARMRRGALPLREEARGSGRVCTVSGRLRHDSARWPASMSQSAGFPALDAERLATVRRTRRVSDAECWVAVLQGAGLRGRWVAGSLGTGLRGLVLRVQRCSLKRKQARSVFAADLRTFYGAPFAKILER